MDNSVCINNFLSPKAEILCNPLSINTMYLYLAEKVCVWGGGCKWFVIVLSKLVPKVWVRIPLRNCKKKFELQHCWIECSKVFIAIWNCSDSVVFCVFPFTLYIQKYVIRFRILSESSAVEILYSCHLLETIIGICHQLNYRSNWIAGDRVLRADS